MKAASAIGSILRATLLGGISAIQNPCASCSEVKRKTTLLVEVQTKVKVLHYLFAGAIIHLPPVAELHDRFA